jgi:lipopolysaccharide export system protein LptA
VNNFKIIFIFLALLAGIPVVAQETESQDSLVILVSSKSAQVVDVDGASYRKVIGPARFLHNDTYLLCDTAYWNVETKIIDAWGNVSILQEETVLTSDKLTYLIDQDLAQFRGSVVQLTDKDHNTLRTRHLDYNTKDSLAIFKNGASMRDKDGQIIESFNGTYDSKVKRFTFLENVNMFTDSIFVKTSELVYESDKDLATFASVTDVWKEENMLSSSGGWYNKGKEIFFFTDNVHLMSEDQEGWCDSLYFRRETSDIEMLGNAQVTDTTRNVFALAGRIEYIDTLSKTTLTRKPAVISQTEEEDGSIDTVYLGAEKLVYFAIPMFQVDSLAAENAQKRLKDLDVDPVGEYRKKAAEEAAKAAEESAMNDPNLAAKKAAEERKKAEAKAQRAKMEKAAMDTVAVSDTTAAMDSLAVGPMAALEDSLAAVPPVDSTRIGFLEAIRNVKIFKKNMQVVCDSLLYTDLDSLARLFETPVIWQETTRQYAADSITLVVNGGKMQKASLMSNAFVTLQQDETHYNQIRGTEMLAFFGDKSSLERFDVLGGASALFYIEENGVLATVNKTDSKMLSATFKDGQIERIYYYDQPKNDAYPKVQLKQDERNLKGFNWQPDRRPADRNAVTPLSLRPSQRTSYAARPRARFKQTDIYFPGYIADINRQIEIRDSLKRIRQIERKQAEDIALEKARLDSLALSDSLARVDSLFRVDSLARVDSIRLASKLITDSLKVNKDVTVSADSLKTEVKVLTPEEQKAAVKAGKEKQRQEAKAAREAARKKKQEEREERWEEMDKRDEIKAKAKEEKRKEKERKRKRKALEAAAREAEKDAQLLEEYIEKYQKQKEKSLSRKTGKDNILKSKVSE